MNITSSSTGYHNQNPGATSPRKKHLWKSHAWIAVEKLWFLKTTNLSTMIIIIFHFKEREKKTMQRRAPEDGKKIYQMSLKLFASQSYDYWPSRERFLQIYYFTTNNVVHCMIDINKLKSETPNQT